VRILVVTIVHHPQDARIFHRQIRALLEAGHHVTYAAPFTGYGTVPPPTVQAVDLPRAQGRQRLSAVRAARRLLRDRAGNCDLVLLHDPELLLAAAGLSLPPTVWDVHEDTAAAVTLKPWLPAWARRLVAAVVRVVERVAERRVHILLAEDGYQSRFQWSHPVVPNTTYVPDVVPPPGAERVVYVGHLSAKRGARELIALGRRLQQVSADRVRVDIVGHADDSTAAEVQAADRQGVVRWHGFLPNDEALSLVEGSLAGVSLLHDEPNYRHSRPTKVIEYMARGVPVVTTPTPPARALIEETGCGFVVDFGPPEQVAEDTASAVLKLRDDESLRRACATAGRQAAAQRFSWAEHARDFVAVLDEIATRLRPSPGHRALLEDAKRARRRSA
jgi:glycosyltransferase involved in cell wall biosynthesis